MTDVASFEVVVEAVGFLLAPNLDTATLLVDVVDLVVVVAEVFAPNERVEERPGDLVEDIVEDDGRVDSFDTVVLVVAPGREELVIERFKALELTLLVSEEAPGEGRFNIEPVEARLVVGFVNPVEVSFLSVSLTPVLAVEEVTVRDDDVVVRLLKVGLVVEVVLVVPLVVVVDRGFLDAAELAVVVVVRVNVLPVVVDDDDGAVDELVLEAREDILDIPEVVVEVGFLFNVDVVPTLEVVELLTVAVDVDVDVGLLGSLLEANPTFGLEEAVLVVEVVGKGFLVMVAVDGLTEDAVVRLVVLDKGAVDFLAILLFACVVDSLITGWELFDEIAAPETAAAVTAIAAAATTVVVVTPTVSSSLEASVFEEAMASLGFSSVEPQMSSVIFSV